jgi:hypothetical protein
MKKRPDRVGSDPPRLSQVVSWTAMKTYGGWRTLNNVADVIWRNSPLPDCGLSSLAGQPAPLVRQGGLKFQRLAARSLKDDPSAFHLPRYGRP